MFKNIKKILVDIIFLITLPSVLFFAEKVEAASFENLGQLSSGSGSNGKSINHSGSIIVGSNSIKSPNHFPLFEAFVWDKDHGMTSIGFLPNGTSSEANDISSDGSIIVGTGNGNGPWNQDLRKFRGSKTDRDQISNQPFRWDKEHGMVSLGLLSGNYGMATGVSDDGSVIVGISDNQAFRWDEEHGMVSLGFLPNGDSSNAFDISGNGMVIIGHADNGERGEAFRWNAKKGMVGLGHLPGGLCSLASATNKDGSVIVGKSCYNNENFVEAFRWDEKHGMVGLGFLPSKGTYHNSKALDVSDNGSVIVGESNGAAFVWTKDNGLQTLFDILTNKGIDLTGVEIFSADSISGDGTIITGTAVKNEQSFAYRADISGKKK